MIIIFSQEEYESFLKSSKDKQIGFKREIPNGNLLVQKPLSEVTPTPMYLNIQDASLYTQQAVQTLYAKCSQRKIPYIKRGRKLLFLKSDLDQWLLEGKKPSLNEIKKGLSDELS